VATNSGLIIYTPPANSTNSDTFAYWISDGYVAPVQGTVTVNLLTACAPTPNLTATGLEAGGYAVNGNGIPGRTYTIQFDDSFPAADWQPLGTATADPNGFFQITDSGGTAQRVYRSIYP
jgi:hypothetical protein